ncbi:hypothetical protein U1Q18_044435 [Sarracenia purpurea var. burkii]
MNQVGDFVKTSEPAPKVFVNMSQPTPMAGIGFSTQKIVKSDYTIREGPNYGMVGNKAEMEDGVYTVSKEEGTWEYESEEGKAHQVPDACVEDILQPVVSGKRGNDNLARGSQSWANIVATNGVSRPYARIEA